MRSAFFPENIKIINYYSNYKIVTFRHSSDLIRFSVFPACMDTPYYERFMFLLFSTTIPIPILKLHNTQKAWYIVIKYNIPQLVQKHYVFLLAS